jgi:hypothetical protein
MTLLCRRLGYVNVHPYYVYMHDLVKGVEDLRTTLQLSCAPDSASCRMQRSCARGSSPGPSGVPSILQR